MVVPCGLGDHKAFILEAQKKSKKNGLTRQTGRDMYSVPAGKGQRRLVSKKEKVREGPGHMWAPLKGV